MINFWLESKLFREGVVYYSNSISFYLYNYVNWNVLLESSFDLSSNSDNGFEIFKKFHPNCITCSMKGSGLKIRTLSLEVSMEAWYPLLIALLLSLIVDTPIITGSLRFSSLSENIKWFVRIKIFKNFYTFSWVMMIELS